MRETAYTKINLALHVRERRADGYHRVETAFAFADEGDELAVGEGEGLTLSVTGRFGSDIPADGDNLVLRAARILAERFGPLAGAALSLDKRLPVAAGIGGGSADAAAALRLLTRWWGLDADESALLSLARRLGADVPACLLSRAVRGSERGDVLAPFDAPELGGMPVLLANPGVPLATAAVFACWDGRGSGPLGRWQDGHNDLELPARSLVPSIADVLLALGDARFARMSGSGATCFGLYESVGDRDAAAARIAAEHRDWWLLASRLR